MYQEIYEINSYSGINNYLQIKGFDISSNKEQDIFNSNGAKVGHFINLKIGLSSLPSSQNNQLNTSGPFKLNPFSTILL